MGETKESVEKRKKTKKGKREENITIGDIIFRTLVLLSIFLTVLIVHAIYIQR